MSEIKVQVMNDKEKIIMSQQGQDPKTKGLLKKRKHFECSPDSIDTNKKRKREYVALCESVHVPESQYGHVLYTLFLSTWKSRTENYRARTADIDVMKKCGMDSREFWSKIAAYSTMADVFRFAMTTKGSYKAFTESIEVWNLILRFVAEEYPSVSFFPYVSFAEAATIFCGTGGGSGGGRSKISPSECRNLFFKALYITKDRDGSRKLMMTYIMLSNREAVIVDAMDAQRIKLATSNLLDDEEYVLASVKAGTEVLEKDIIIGKATKEDKIEEVAYIRRDVYEIIKAMDGYSKACSAYRRLYEKEIVPVHSPAVPRRAHQRFVPLEPVPLSSRVRKVRLS